MIYWYNRKNKEKHNCTIPDGHRDILLKVWRLMSIIIFWQRCQLKGNVCRSFFSCSLDSPLWTCTTLRPCDDPRIKNTHCSCCDWSLVSQLALFALMHCLCLVSESLSFWVSEFLRPCDDPRIKNTRSSCCDWSLVSQLALFVLMHCLCLCRVSEFLRPCDDPRIKWSNYDVNIAKASEDEGTWTLHTASLLCPARLYICTIIVYLSFWIVW